MLVLAIESATELAGVALADESGVIASSGLSRGRHHGEFLAPAIEFCCERAGVQLGDLDAVCVDVGPGLFTGLRVGVGTAKALAFALGTPVVVASSLEVLATALGGAGREEGTLLVPVVDARRGEVFAARFRVSGGEPVRTEPDALWEPARLAASLGVAGEPVLLGGDGALRYSSLFEESCDATSASGDFAHPPLATLARMGVRSLGEGKGLDGADVLPVYLRDADVRINWEQRFAPRANPVAPMTGA